MRRLMLSIAALVCLALVSAGSRPVASVAQATAAGSILAVSGNAVLLSTGQIHVLQAGAGWSYVTSVPVPEWQVQFFMGCDERECALVDASGNGWVFDGSSWQNLGPPGSVAVERQSWPGLKARYR